MRDGKVLTPARGDLAPCLEDWRALLRRELRKRDLLPLTSFDECLSAGRAHVLNPSRAVPEHRDKIALTMVSNDDKHG